MLKQIQKLIINEEYLKKVPRPETEQYEALKESIKERGQLEPITVNEKFEIIDGYTRFQICNELKIQPEFKIRKFVDSHEESLFVRTVNQKRRHLNPLQIYQMYEDEIEEIKQQNITIANQQRWDKRKGKVKKNTPRMKYENSTQYKTMKLTGLSAGQIEGIVYLKRNADDETIKDVLDGKKKLFEVVNKMKEGTTPRKEKNDYRSRFKITLDVLSCINDNNDCIISMISRKANLSHYAVLNYTEPLKEVDFIKETRTKKSGFRFFEITTKGIDFLDKARTFFELLPERLRT